MSAKEFIPERRWKRYAHPLIGICLWACFIASIFYLRIAADSGEMKYYVYSGAGIIGSGVFIWLGQLLSREDGQRH